MKNSVAKPEELLEHAKVNTCQLQNTVGMRYQVLDKTTNYNFIHK